MIGTADAQFTFFANSGKLASYAGLVPTTSSNGGKMKQGKLVKSCNHHLKWALIEAVYPATRKSCCLRNKYNALKNKKPANVAKAAIARQLMNLVYTIWTEERDFIQGKPDRNRTA